MQRNTLTVAALLGLAMLMCGSAFAVDQGVATKSDNLMVARVGDITKMKIMNASGEDLGKIEDLVIDMSTGKIRYAAISFGGFLGVGDKMFAVPFESMALRQNAKDNSRHFELNVTKEQLQNAPGFDKNNWPDFANPTWGATNDKHYSQPVKR